MKTIKYDNKPELDIDDFMILDNGIEPKKKNKKKKHKKKKKDNYKIHNTKKKKSKKGKKKKKNKGKHYEYASHNKHGFFSKLSDSVNVDVKSKVKVDITDETISNVLATGYNIVKCIMNKGK